MTPLAKGDIMDAKLQELKVKYSLYWKNWYYWPLEDDAGQAEAKRQLDKIGAELNAYKNLTPSSAGASLRAIGCSDLLSDF